MKKTFLAILTACMALNACTPKAEKAEPQFKLADPADIVMYQVNPRVFAHNNSLNAVTGRMDSIRALGVNTLWIMPIFPIGTTKTKNSPYSISDYQDVAPEFGTLDDYKNLVKVAHSKGMAVIQDWVPNHTSWDHPWITEHPDWYTRDAEADTIICPQGPDWDWTDVADLNYDNKDLRAAMTSAMKFWITEVGLDGFRCDVADFVPVDFWKDAIAELRQAAGTRQIVMLSEGKRPDNFTVGGFDMNYGWDYKDSLINVWQKGYPVSNLFEADKAEYAPLGPGNYKMRFTTNHDHSVFATPPAEFGGNRGAMAAYVATIYPHGGVLVYSSQEVAHPTPISFFYYVPVDWNANPEIYKEYQQLIALYNEYPALRSKGKLTPYPDNDIMLFEKSDDVNRILVGVNVRNEVKTIAVPAAWQGKATNLTSGKEVTLGETLELQPYEYLICKK